MLPFVVWATPQFGHGRVDAAGKALVGSMAKDSVSPSERDKLAWALDVVDNWRSSHSYPLQVVYMALRTRVRTVEANALVAQRLKRLTSIYAKLANEPTMKLSQMQDIGGCRAVLSSIPKLRRLAQKYDSELARHRREREKGQDRLDKSLIIEKYDYVANPKADGYRSLHFVCKYQTAKEAHRAHSGLRIEIQLRTRLQHMWATAVEVAQTFTDKALRSPSGDKEWRRFFALMGSAFAAREKQVRVPDTPVDESDLTAELKYLSEKLQVELVLSAYGEAAEIVTHSAGKAKRFLLELDPDKKELRVSPFSGRDIQQATATLFASERNVDDKTLRVLVSVDSIAALRRAYPNYYLDTTQFLEAVKTVIS